MSNTQKRKLVFVVNVDWFFISHRLPLALEAINRNWFVYLITTNTGNFDRLTALGLNCISVDFDRSGQNPVKEFSIIKRLRGIYQEIQPNVIHHITLKPSIYGTIASKSLKNVKVVNAVSGLGYSFTNNRRFNIGSRVLLLLLKYAFADKKSYFIFQNPDDLNYYKSLNFLTSLNNTIIKGSGVDENIFFYTPPGKKPIVNVTLLARMLKDKGVLEFIKAAEILRSKYEGRITFNLIGAIDLHNPAHIKEEYLLSKCDGAYINWVGYKKDARACYDQADIVCLPSYREGLPKALVEAMAVGRPIVTTNAIGCKECVDDGLNGFMVNVKDHKSLAEKIEKLATSEDLRLRMGLNSRKKMLNGFTLKLVVEQTFLFYDND